MTAEDIINYYLNNPPFEVSDQAKYQEMLHATINQTLNELSRNNPVLDEKEFHTPKPENDNQEFVFVDIYSDIDPRWIEFIILTPKDNIPVYYAQYIPANLIRNGSVLEYIALSDGLHILKELTSTYIQKLIYQGRKIKLLPDTDYYTLYYRAKSLDELTPSDINYFQKLLEVNLLLNAYQSSLFTSEQGIRSVSISGLSVSLNVPTRESVVRALQQTKNNIISNMALTDYGDGLIGHW